MALAEVGDAALEAAEEVPDAVDRSDLGRRGGVLEAPLHGQANHLRALAAVAERLSIQLLDQTLRHADGELTLHGMHRITLGCRPRPLPMSSVRDPSAVYFYSTGGDRG